MAILFPSILAGRFHILRMLQDLQYSHVRMKFLSWDLEDISLVWHTLGSENVEMTAILHG